MFGRLTKACWRDIRKYEKDDNSTNRICRNALRAWERVVKNFKAKSGLKQLDKAVVKTRAQLTSEAMVIHQTGLVSRTKFNPVHVCADGKDFRAKLVGCKRETKTCTQSVLRGSGKDKHKGQSAYAADAKGQTLAAEALTQVAEHQVKHNNWNERWPPLPPPKPLNWVRGHTSPNGPPPCMSSDRGVRGNSSGPAGTRSQETTATLIRPIVHYPR